MTRTLGLPRALEALYAALRTDRFTTLQELLDLPILPEQVVQAYVGEAFTRLDTNAQKVMQALAVYNRPVTPAAVDYLLAPHLPAIDSAPILQRLANMHFARKESGRFYLHPVDREFAVSLLPEGDFNDKLRNNSGLKLLESLNEVITKYPDVFQNQETFEKAEKEFPPNFLRDIVSSLQSLDPVLQEKMQDPKNFEDEVYLAALDNALKIPQAYTRYALTNRAADYFAQARKPRAEWKKLEDLSAQLAEFDLRCAAGDYDAAGWIMSEIGFDYMLLWGHYRLTIDMHEKLQRKIKDMWLQSKSAGDLGSAYYSIGQFSTAINRFNQALETTRQSNNHQDEAAWLCNLANTYDFLGEISKAIEFYEQALDIARETGAKKNEGAILDNLGDTYRKLDNTNKAIDCAEKSLQISKEVGNRSGETVSLDNIGLAFLVLGEHEQAKERFIQSIKIADEIYYAYMQNQSRYGLGEAYLFQNDLVNARATIEAALQYDVPENNHNASALHGIIALRQGERETAQEAFAKSIAQADEILSKTAEYYSALDAKGLAICGLAITSGDSQLKADCHLRAIETFRKAREIAPHAGVVKSVLRLFDELVKCDEEGILKAVRPAAEGAE